MENGEIKNVLPVLHKANVMRRFSVGQKVRMVNCAEAELYPDTVWICRSDSWMISKEREVVLLEGRAGCFGADCLALVNGV